MLLQASGGADDTGNRFILTAAIATMTSGDNYTMSLQVRKVPSILEHPMCRSLWHHNTSVLRHFDPLPESSVVKRCLQPVLTSVCDLDTKAKTLHPRHRHLGVRWQAQQCLPGFENASQCVAFSFQCEGTCFDQRKVFELNPCGQLLGCKRDTVTADGWRAPPNHLVCRQAILHRWSAQYQRLPWQGLLAEWCALDTILWQRALFTHAESAASCESPA